VPVAADALELRDEAGQTTIQDSTLVLCR